MRKSVSVFPWSLPPGSGQSRSEDESTSCGFVVRAIRKETGPPEFEYRSFMNITERSCRNGFMNLINGVPGLA
jgi:hypothetical protein